MARRHRGLPNTLYLSLVPIDATSNIPLYRQIYSGLRDAIVNGRLAPNTKLPSTRDLASIWNVSRNTLRNAFDQLIAEGYLDAGVGRGTFVMEQQKRPFPPNTPPTIHSERIRPISSIGRALEPLGKSLHQSSWSGSAFAAGVPDLDAFPHKVWTQILNRIQRRRQKERPSQHINGLPQLREAIASYLISARGLQCSPEQIDIVPGSVSGMFITALSLLSPGEKVWMEDPGFLNASGMLRYRGIELFPISVDKQGLVVEEGIAKAPDARLAYVTPSHQYPLGETMSLARRQQLLDWAGYNNSWIFEDDYDSEFRYDGPPISAIQGLDQQQRVIYFGTFSKILMPELRLGYVVLPPDLVDVYTGVKMPISIYSPTLIQEAVAAFMLEGHFVRHIRKMRQKYHARRDALVYSIEKHLSGVLTLGATDCGLHAVTYLDAHYNETAVLQQTQKLGMALAPLSMHYLGESRREGLIFGFSNMQPDEIEPYIKKLAVSLQKTTRH